MLDKENRAKLDAVSNALATMTMASAPSFVKIVESIEFEIEDDDDDDLVREIAAALEDGDIKKASDLIEDLEDSLDERSHGDDDGRRFDALGVEYVTAHVTWPLAPKFPAFVQVDTRWNGFAIPYFTREVGEQIAKYMNENATIDTVYGVTMRYDEAGNKFVSLTPIHDLSGDPQHASEYPARMFRDGNDRYAIGAFEWAWEEVEGSDDE